MLKDYNMKVSAKQMAQSEQKDPLKKVADYPFRITLLTLASYACGLVYVHDLYISCALMMGLAVLSLVLVKSYKVCQRYSSVLSYIATTYVFGLIHAYTYEQIIAFIGIKNENHTQQVVETWPLLQIYFSFMCVYYYFEFQLNNNFHHQKLCWQSFLIYHSKPYTIANAFSLTEHLLAKYVFCFGYKNSHILIYPALMVMILGEGLRITAFFTAKNNFTHLVRYRKDPRHQLITHGVYSFFRHPAYTGYFYFSVASQLFLGNWISAVGFFITLVKFFNDRISDEQLMLSKFFQKYLYYKKKTHILIPFVKDPDSQQIMKALIRGSKSNSVYED